MGIDFRNGKYTRRVKYGKRTVKEGEAVAIWDRYGQHHQVIGPRLVYLFYSTIRFLDRHVARENQYIVVENKDGSIDHMQGPCAVWENPVFHRNVRVRDAVEVLSERECIVVLEEAASKLTKTVIAGPTKYFPKPRQSLQVFKWTGDEGSRVVMQVKSARFETSVVVMKDMTATLSLQYSILDPLFLANATTDLTGDLIGALRADAMILQDQDDLQMLQKEPLTKLRDKLPRLFSRCAKLQIELESLTLIDVRLPLELKQAQESKAKSQADLLIQEESVRMKIRLAELELEGETHRVDKRNTIAQQALESRIGLRRREYEAAAEIRAQQSRATLEFLQQLKAMDVDMTQFVCQALKQAGPGDSPAKDALCTLAKDIAKSFADGTRED